MHVVISLCDALNPGLGYQIRVEQDGRLLLFTSMDPSTGRSLTYADCLRIAGMYGPADLPRQVAVPSTHVQDDPTGASPIIGRD